MNPARSLTVIMPCLNEELNVSHAIEDVLSAMNRLSLDGEILVIDDGSTDRTAALVRDYEVRDRRVRLIQHGRNLGVGAAFTRGVSEASKDHVLVLHGDNPMEPYDIMMYMPVMSYVDVLVPHNYNAHIRSFFRRNLSKLYLGIVNLTFGTSFKYTNGHSIFKRSLFDKLKPYAAGFSYQAELLVRLNRLGYLMAEVPVFTRRSVETRSKAISFKSLTEVIGSYLRLLRVVYFSPEASLKGSVPDSASVTACRIRSHEELSRTKTGPL